jgi:hypothetical protein
VSRSYPSPTTTRTRQAPGLRPSRPIAARSSRSPCRRGARAVRPSAAPAASAASAADSTNEAPALDAVTVHSRNRIERLQDVPISVSVTTGAELARLDAYGVDAIAKRAANVSWNQGNQRTSSLSIRGIGKIGQTEAQDPSVGVIVDGVSYAYNALTSSFDFVDVDTVEVARGPQGTLQGKNASVGSITINYKRPTFTPTADYTLALRQEQRRARRRRHRRPGHRRPARLARHVLGRPPARRARQRVRPRPDLHQHRPRVGPRAVPADAHRRLQRALSKATSSRARARRPTATRSTLADAHQYADGAPIR